MTLLPAVPLLREREALTGHLGRLASENRMQTPGLLTQTGADDLYRRRVAAPAALFAIETLTGIASDELAAATLARYPSAVVGRTDVSYGWGDPLGWAGSVFSTYCSDCLRDGNGWRIEHQTALALTCPVHGILLRASCAGCSKRSSMCVRAERTCRHYPAAALGLTSDLPDGAERLMLEALERTRTDTRPVMSLRRIRAATALLWIDALEGGSRGMDTRALGARIDELGPGPGGGGARAHVRLRRPPGEPWINAHLARILWPHVDPATLDLDPAWVADLTEMSAQSPEREGRATRFLEELGYVPPAKGNEPINEGWLDLAAEHLEARCGEITASEVPSCLWSPGENIFGEWSEAAARAALLHLMTAAVQYRASIVSLGHPHNSTALTRAVLISAPTLQQKRDFAAAVAVFDPVNGPHGEDGRRAQALITYVPPPVTRRLMTALPADARVSSGQMGALWLWAATTHAPVSSAPFIDGRRTWYLIPALDRWMRDAPADDKVALLDWNYAELSRLAPDTTIPTPAAAAAV